MRSRVPLFALLIVAGSVALPLVAHAGGIPFFGPIIGNSAGTAPENICPLGWGYLITVINNIISLLITLAIVFVAPLMIAYAGFLLVISQGDSGKRTEARKILTNTIVGIVIALAGWMIVAAIMAALYNPDTPIAGGKLGVWSNLITSGGLGPCIDLKGSVPPTVTPPTVVVTPPAVSCATSYTNTLPGISVSSSGNCCDRNNRSCTSLDGMLQATIQQIKNVKNKCGGITVTGGTETGHASEGGAGSHSSGSKVDLGQNVVSCILGTSGSSSVNPPSFGSAQVKDKCGNIYTWEGNHTDIYVQSTCSL
ncbi:MAG: pilin [bacterium]|nr:pilin [bacterium]